MAAEIRLQVSAANPFRMRLKHMATFEHKLANPVEYFNQPVTRVFVLEPRAKHRTRSGEPQMDVYDSKTGSTYLVDNDEAIAKYIDEILSLNGSSPADGGGRALFSLLSLEDGIAVRDALFGFFAQAKLRLFSGRSTASSSTSGASQSTPPTN
jgi:hypothetical protein